MKFGIAGICNTCWNDMTQPVEDNGVVPSAYEEFGFDYPWELYNW
jgi:hypothetical protein